MKIILNPKYENLRNYLAHIEEHFEKEGQEIHSGRNVIRTLQQGGLTLCVKRYAQPTLGGRMACRLYKSPKGKLAYTRPLQLRERGFESPEPVAFVKTRKGLFKTSTYFVCLLSSYRYSMATVDALPREELDEVARSFARYAARLHSNGFLHRDFSSGNILYDRVKGRYRFALVDTNSMKCGRPVSIEKGCASLADLQGDDYFFLLLADEYAKARAADPTRCLRLIGEARRHKQANAAEPPHHPE